MSESLPQDKLHLVKLPSQALPANWREYIAQGKAATVDNMDPSCPFLVLEKSDHEKVYEWLNLRSLWVAKSMPNDIISPDPTPKVSLRRATKATVTSSVNATAKKRRVSEVSVSDMSFDTDMQFPEVSTLRKYPFQAWDPMNTRSGFFAYRPVSAIQILCNSEPDDKSLLVGGQRRNYWSTSMSNDCLIPNHNIALLGRNQQLIGTHQSRRYSTVAFKILTKLLKHA
uniref:Uncharacterized protein n=1 Tax=Leersia perrieri TaxID=77586 RepID=A0A0D9V1X3_9ORYZ